MKNLIVAMLFSMSAFASPGSNIRVIGGGGGDMEMISLTIFNQIISILEMCHATNGDRCLFEEPLDGSGFSISELPPLPEALVFHTGGDEFKIFHEEKRVSINRNLLEGNLWVIVGSAVLSYSLKEVGIAADVASYLFENRFYSVKSFSISKNQDLLAVAGPDQWILSLEIEGLSSIDLNSMIAAQAQCNGNLKINSLALFSPVESGFTANIIWSCGNEEKSATLYAKVTDGGSVNLRLFNVTDVSNFEGNCHSSLTSDRNHDGFHF